MFIIILCRAEGIQDHMAHMHILGRVLAYLRPLHVGACNRHFQQPLDTCVCYELQLLFFLRNSE
jgi:hypothetical protein